MVRGEGKIPIMHNRQLMEWLEQHLLQLNLESTAIDYTEGYTRLGYSEEERKAMEVFESIARSLHMSVRKDQAGNRIARWEGREKLPPMALGSHVDTVKNGGAYDGVAGVLCALAAIHQLQLDGFVPVRPIEVICFAAEESACFGVSTIGSEAMAGMLDKEAICSLEDQEGLTVQEAIISAGLDWDSIQDAERQKDDVYKYLELHIEQGSRLEHAGKQFGVVTAIARPVRFLLEIIGQTNHSGTTYMDERKDALVAASSLVSFIYHRAKELSQSEKHPIVATVGTFNVSPNATTSVPGFVELGIDIRSVDDSLKSTLGKEIDHTLKDIQKEYHVESTIEKIVDNPSVFLDENFAKKIKDIGEKSGFTSMYMESGAGHDVMNMAKKWPAGLIFIPCKDGISHNPKEYASLEDLAMGSTSLTHIIKSETQ